VTRVPDFDEIVGEDAGTAERERLRRVHDLLVTAGPPPELSPELEAGPTLAMSLDRRRSHGWGRRRIMLLAAAIVALALAFLGGFMTGNSSDSGSVSSAKVLELHGTALAPDALASLRIDPADPAGNWPMKLSAVGLPKLPPHGYYAVFFTRHGKILAPCGTFIVRNTETGVSITLNAPYELEKGDSWVITRQEPGEHTPGRIVMRPVTT